MDIQHYEFVKGAFEYRSTRGGRTTEPQLADEYLNIAYALQDEPEPTHEAKSKIIPMSFWAHISRDGLSKLKAYAASIDREDAKHLGIAMLAGFWVEMDVDIAGADMLLLNEIESYKSIRDPARVVRRTDAADEGILAAAVHRAEIAADQAKEAAIEIAKSQSGAADKFAEFLAVAEKTRSELASVVERSANSVADLRARTDDAEARIQALLPQVEWLKQTMDVSTENIERFKKEVRESLGQASTKDLWARRAVWHRVSFWGSLALILGLIVGVPVAAFYYREAVLGFVKEINNFLPVPDSDDVTFTTTIAILNRILVLGLPIALYIWLIKFVIRYNQHSLLLAEDAAQRSTMIDVYVKLIAKDAEPDDRQVIFTALFRPGIAQSTDNVDLPIIEAIKALKS